jgi:UDP:flavonoid glycosyltransferase YjiC (YdhE family)
MTERRRILFFAHAVTMAHFARPLKWIEWLDTELLDIYLASHPKFKNLSQKAGITFVDITCIEAAEFERIVVNAEPIYDSKTFEAHISEDIRIIEKIRPDLVIGDFRHSLTVSCRLRKVKYINLTNAYWHPEIRLRFPLPEAPIVRLLGEGVANKLLRPFLPLALKVSFFKMAFLLRKSFKKVNLTFTDYRQVIIDGDITLYCDTPELVPLKTQLSHEKFVGPLIWSMPVALPEWWGSLDPEKRRIFITLGSSGHADSWPMIIQALGKLDAQIIVALAGKRPKLPMLHNVFVADFLPIEPVCQRADLVICNGGSPLVHSALSYGVPAIGIVCNNDQLLNMAHVQKCGAGLMLRFWNLSEEKLTDAVNEILHNPKYLKHAKTIQAEFEAINNKRLMQNAIEML